MGQATNVVLKDAKGDVYEVVGGSEKHPKESSRNLGGTVFRTVKRNTTFEEYSKQNDHHQWLDDSTEVDGYLLITADMFANSETSKASAEEVEGIFIPYGADRKDVADAVRRRFGAGSALLKAPSCPNCGFYMEHEGGGLYCCPSCHETQQV